MHLREAGDDRLAGLRVAVHVERGILLLQPPQRGVHLLLVALVLGLDRERHDRRRERERLDLDGRVDVGQHVAGARLLELGDGADRPVRKRVGRRVILALERQQLADPLLGVRVVVDQVRVGGERAREHAQQVDLAAERVGDRLEDVGERRRAADLGHVARPRRRRQPLDDQVEQAVRADVARRSAAADREELALGDELLQRRRHLLAGDLVALEVALHQLVRRLGDDVHELVVVLVGDAPHVGGDLGRLVVDAAVAVVQVGDHVHEVDDAVELVLRADRQLDGHAPRREPRLQRLERGEEVGPLAVEQVDEDEPREAELVAAPPQPLGADLDAQHAGDRPRSRPRPPAASTARRPGSWARPACRSG